MCRGNVVVLGATASRNETIGSGVDIIEFVRNARHPLILNIINGLEGAIRPEDILDVLSWFIVPYSMNPQS